VGTFGTQRLSDAETDRESAVRAAVACPICVAPVGAKCAYYNHRSSANPNRTTEVCSHTARYDLAAALGVVPIIAPSPGRGIPMLQYQTIPSGIWTRLLSTNIEVEVFQDTGRPQNVIIEGARLKWPNAYTFPARTTTMLRPPNGQYPPGWVPPLEGSWWVSELSTPLDRKDSVA